MDISKFKGFSELLDSLEKSVYSDILELIFCYRSGTFSAVVVFNQKEIVEELVGFELPDELLKFNSYRYFVDLESINTDKIRIYVDSNMNDNVSLYGYYFNNSGNILEKKIYKNNDIGSLLIDRYDGSDNLLNSNEEEVDCVESDWKGPKQIVDIAKTLIGNVNQYRYLFLKKISKDQSYIRIRDNPIADKSNL